MQHPRIEQLPHHRSLLPPASPQPPSSAGKNSYVGLTLKEYFHITDSKPQLDNIDEQNNSELSSGTPCFGGDEQKQEKQRVYRRNRNKTEVQELVESRALGSTMKGGKMVTLSLEELGNIKNAVKLPSIHEQRQKNTSRQALKDNRDNRDLKSFEKKEGRTRDEPMNLATFLKKEENAKGALGRNIINARRGIRSRVTSTSFYHMNMRERDRVKTEEEIDSALEKSFVITRYGGMHARSHKNRDDMAGLKKYENSFKLTKH